MTVLVENSTGRIIAEGTTVEDDEGKQGVYTGYMPAHSRNERGLVYVQYPKKEWEDSMFPERIGAHLVDL